MFKMSVGGMCVKIYRLEESCHEFSHILEKLFIFVVLKLYCIPHSEKKYYKHLSYENV